MLYRSGIRKICLLFLLSLAGSLPLRAEASEPRESAEQYRQYQARFDGLERVDEIEEAGDRKSVV